MRSLLSFLEAKGLCGLGNPLCCGTDLSDVFTFASPSFARVFCVSSAGCCETPFQAVARLCPRLCEGTGRSHGRAQTLCWGSGP